MFIMIDTLKFQIKIAAILDLTINSMQIMKNKQTTWKSSEINNNFNPIVRNLLIFVLFISGVYKYKYFKVRRIEFVR